MEVILLKNATRILDGDDKYRKAIDNIEGGRMENETCKQNE